MKIIRRLFILSTATFFVSALIDNPAMVIIFAFTTFILGAALIGLDTNERANENAKTRKED